MEVPELRTCGRQLNWGVLQCCLDKQQAASRHRHQNGARWQEHSQQDCVQGNISRQVQECLQGPGPDPALSCWRQELLPV